MEHFYHLPEFGENWFTFKNLYSFFATYLPDNSKIVEVGCWKGKSVCYLAVEIINNCKAIKIDAVDTWHGSLEHHEFFGLSQQDIKDDSLYNTFLSNIKPVSHIVNPIRLSSIEASRLYQDNSVDAVFIDACHEYDSVKNDIAAWLPKVKKGGFLGGHDYAFYWPAVIQAVDESLSPILKGENSWLYTKPY